MKIKNIVTEIEVFDNAEELSINEQQLIEQARDAMHNAYAPYSQFKVGAALLLSNGVVVIGNNQENAAYPSGLCAERVAIYSASAQYPGVTISAIAITAFSTDRTIEKPIAPCGSCRQSILEYEMKQANNISMILCGSNGEVHRIKGIKQLLPLHFDQDALNGTKD